MDIDRRLHPDAIELVIEGRLDSYWADHLDAALAEIVREGHDRLRLDLSRTMFLSSAGVAVLMKYYKQLLRINGSLAIVEASEAVQLVLDMTRLTPILVRPAQPAPTPAAKREGRPLDHGGARFEVFELDPAASLTCRTLGDGIGLGEIVGDGQPILCHPSLLAVGIGAIGGGQADCQGRFGDLLAAGGAIVYQPADGTNVPDYLISGDDTADAADTPPAPEARLLYGLACEGPFAAFSRFDATTEVGAVRLSDLAGGCLEIANGPAAGVVAVAETSGLVGAVLRRPPTAPTGAGGNPAGGGFFAYPQIRDRLLFTAERAYARCVVLVVGIVGTADTLGQHPQCRPIGRAPGLVGHFHAAAFAFRPFRRGRLDLGETLTTLFESERVLGMLHLLFDDRAAGGVGESEFARGACWTAPIRRWT